MSNVLYIQASPRGKRSKSSTVADAFVAAYQAAHLDNTVEMLNVFDAELPAFDGPALNAKYAILHGESPNDSDREAWRAVEAIIEPFVTADKLVLATPMWNFSIPYRLKHYLDLLVQPTYTFAFDPDTGYEGLVKGKPAMVIYARGGAYGTPETSGFDLQTHYVETIRGFMGFEDIRSVIVEPTLMGGPDVAKEAVENAIAQAEKMAARF
ncbi:MAG: FMN-dependent NADH-azoreductase [Planctomycetota bacterium]|jgi:FMN-dependent NADH-azoreductase